MGYPHVAAYPASIVAGYLHRGRVIRFTACRYYHLSLRSSRATCFYAFGISPVVVATPRIWRFYLFFGAL